ncbi:calcium:proton antiporter [Microbacterium soli]|uniref:Calcium:proton antiporter n=1 Tax=Microbacterium soli TaxID=446075 RepID=A0ABP7NKV4_9MICO
MRIPAPLRATLTPTAVLRLVLGWGSVLLLSAFGPSSPAGLPTPVLWLLLAGVVVVITISSFGVVTEAEHLAHRLGDPYGTLVLTLSIAGIEVILISAVMLGPGEHTTIARDSVMAVSMIILNLVVGVALLVAAHRRRDLRVNSTGFTQYLGMLIVLLSAVFALPALIGEDGSYTPAQAIPLILLTLGLYAFFLARQMGVQRTDFQELPDIASTRTPSSTSDEVRPPIAAVLRQHRAELITRTVMLIVMVLPVVLLSHEMAALLDDGLERLGAPVALSGVLIAMIVFLPETITTIRAAVAGEMQRVSNLCHGALVSTAGITIPAVLTIGLLTGQTVLLAETPTNLLLLGATLLLTLATFAGRRATAVHGATHLFMFVLYGLSVFS